MCNKRVFIATFQNLREDYLRIVQQPSSKLGNFLEMLHECKTRVV